MPNDKGDNNATRTPPYYSPQSHAVWCVDGHACVASRLSGAMPQYASSSCVYANSDGNGTPVKINAY